MSKVPILVVEDDANLLQGIRSVLELDNYYVITAENGKQALNILKNSLIRPELIVSDIMMPQMDGIQLLREVRNESEWVNIPFIFLTARTDKSDIQKGKQLGGDDYITKPFEADDLLIAIRARLDRLKALEASRQREIGDLKRRILMILNHEFRTPLTFVVAYADLLNESNIPNLPPEELMEFLQGVNLGAVRLRRLVENFIQLVEMEIGDAQKNYLMRRGVMYEYEHLIGQAIHTLHNEHGNRTVKVDIEENLPTLVADRVYIQNALVQLLDNAFKFSPPDSIIEAGIKTQDENIVFWVKDHGRGIDTGEHSNIWDPFYQIKREVHEDQGTGAGLAIVRGVAQLHRGYVDVKSKLGEGSMFSIVIPLREGMSTTDELSELTQEPHST